MNIRYKAVSPGWGQKSSPNSPNQGVGNGLVGHMYSRKERMVRYEVGKNEVEVLILG